MDSILKLVLIPKRKLKQWVKIHWDVIRFNPSVPDSFLLENESNLGSKVFLCKDRELISKYPEKTDWSLVCKFSLNTCADLIMKNTHLLKGHLLDIVIGSTNPKLVDLIIRSLRHVDYYDCYNVAINHNPGLTQYLKDNWKYLPHVKFLNKNSKLFDLMMNDPDPNWKALSSRTEPEFSDFLIRNKLNLNWHVVSNNSNSGLTDFLIENEDLLDKDTIVYNRNPKLLHLRIKYLKPPHWNYLSEFDDDLPLLYPECIVWKFMSLNPSKKLTKLIIDNHKKLDYSRLSRNKNSKLNKFMYES